MIDLHCHSACSDGSDLPEYIAALADKLGLAAVALTDHDTLDGLDAFMDMQPSVSTRLIAGIELSCEFAGMDLHVLGLFLDYRDTVLQERVQSLKLRRHRRNEVIFQKLQGLKIDIPSEPIFGKGQEGLVTRGHIAAMIMETGHAASMAEAFHKYLGESGGAYAPFEYLSPDTAFKWVREAGGLPIIAHPGRFSAGRFIWDRAMADLMEMGACGIEAYYSDHSAAETDYFLCLCENLGMAPSGGSDYHGRYKPGCKLGKGWGGLDVPDNVLDGLLSNFTRG